MVAPVFKKVTEEGIEAEKTLAGTVPSNFSNISSASAVVTNNNSIATAAAVLSNNVSLSLAGATAGALHHRDVTNSSTTSEAFTGKQKDSNADVTMSNSKPTSNLNPTSGPNQISVQLKPGPVADKDSSKESALHQNIGKKPTTADFDIVNNNIDSDSYFGKFTEYFSDKYGHAKDSIGTVSDEAFKVFGISSYLASSNTENNASNDMPMPLTTKPNDPNKNNNSNNNKNVINSGLKDTQLGMGWYSSSANIKPNTSPRISTWLMNRSVYDSVTGRNSHQLPPRNSVDAVRNLVSLVKLEEKRSRSDSILSTNSEDSTHNNQSSHYNQQHQHVKLKPIESIDSISSHEFISSSADDHPNFHHLKREHVYSSSEGEEDPFSNLIASPIPTSSNNDDHVHDDDDGITNSIRKESSFSTSSTFKRRRYNYDKKKRKISKEETASRLGEGTIRALRDIALDEALELHQTLRFWTERREKPFLFYLEFAPKLFLTSHQSNNNRNTNYHKDHHESHAAMIAGQNVAQLQAVLARRCSSIGELQQHLWRAGWQSGVAQWGILGSGSEFAAVIGGLDGDIDEHTQAQTQSQFSSSRYQQSTHSFFAALRRGDKKKSRESNRNNKKGGPDYYVDSLFHVRNQRGGAIVKNESALAAWSIDAIRVVRDQLYNAGSGVDPLPHFENWPQESKHFTKEDGGGQSAMGDSMISIDKSHIFDDDQGKDSTSYLPLWATQDVEYDSSRPNILDEHVHVDANESYHGSGITGVSGLDTHNEGSQPTTVHTHTHIVQKIEEEEQKKSIIITDIKLMADEVNGILNSMESYMAIQRKRRLDKLKPPSRLRRSWYIAVVAIPVTGYFAYKLTQGNAGARLASEMYSKICEFFAEHVSEPLESIYRELLTRKGREEITDRKARNDVIVSLKKMIKSWLDDTHPNMPESERVQISNTMDMNLIEATKEYSVQNILEINSIYRLSLIEMQFIKKEMMNALCAMDEIMSSNEINVRLAAMTPAFLLVSSFRFVMRKLYYALFKLGKSKEEVYASFRHIILDIERLLVMRDNPPLAPPRLPSGVEYNGGAHFGYRSTCTSPTRIVEGKDRYTGEQNILSADDLGMLMLLVHECRVMLWQCRRRFTRQELRNVSEDLAELAGERGSVSVQQQLRIVARMCRTYSFLKVVSSGIPFSVEDSIA
mmetsp:Transcript_8304/g.9110  ORF Transcript_8304/g.9110 Transcript_8304/m.9110 type:complete len:1177 (-) Transcript_8304:103-3633(-)